MLNHLLTIQNSYAILNSCIFVISHEYIKFVSIDEFIDFVFIKQRSRVH